MNWDAIGAIGELLSSIVVIVSLVYIAIQVRDTKRAAQRTAHQDRQAALGRTVLTTPELAPILAKVNAIAGIPPFQKAMQETYGLSPAEAELYTRHVASGWRALETDFLTGDLDVRIPIRNRLEGSPSRRFIEYRGAFFDPRFMELVNRIKSELEQERNSASPRLDGPGPRP